MLERRDLNHNRLEFTDHLILEFLQVLFQVLRLSFPGCALHNVTSSYYYYYSVHISLLRSTWKTSGPNHLRFENMMGGDETMCSILFGGHGDLDH